MEPTYKFGVLAGEPASLDGSKSVSVSSWEECVEECENDFECILASQKSPGQCNLFPWNTISDVKKKESGGEGMVAFRLYTNEPSCELNLPTLLHGRTYPLYPNITEAYLWRIDTLDDGYHITYMKIVQEDKMVCGNWSWNRPYADGCNPECRLSMIQLYAEPGELANPLRNFSSTNWDDCVQECYQSNRCVVVYFDEETTKCGYHQVDDILHFVQKATADSGKRGAIKVNLNNETCKYTTEQLLNGTYYMTDNSTLFVDMFWGVMGYMKYPNRLTFWSIHTYEEHYVIMFYHDEKYMLELAEIPACPINMFPMGHLTRLRPSQPLCYRLFNAPNITYVRAKTLCNRLGLDLMPPIYYEFAGSFYGGIAVKNNLLTAWSFPGERNWNVWVGLEHDNQCMNKSNAYCSGNQQWQYSNPSLAIIYYQSPRDTIDFYWGTNEPDMSSDKNCVYAHIDDKEYQYLYTAKCNTTEVDITGFYCASESQKYLLNLPKYSDVAASYGYVDHLPYD
uniref:PAN-3 domain-containing protein n=1 Tax=Caenorhabditis japonica TaxID=281687 RepID=A0A8R1HME0_CAEJA